MIDPSAMCFLISSFNVGAVLSGTTRAKALSVSLQMPPKTQTVFNRRPLLYFLCVITVSSISTCMLCPPICSCGPSVTSSTTESLKAVKKLVTVFLLTLHFAQVSVKEY